MYRSRELRWDPENPGEVELARSVFAKAIATGLVAYRAELLGARSRLVQVRRFEPSWGFVLLVPQLAGG